MWPQLVEHSDNISVVLMVSVLATSLLIARGLSRVRLAGDASGTITLPGATRRDRHTHRRTTATLRWPDLARWLQRARPMAVLPAELGTDGHLRKLCEEIDVAVALAHDAARAQADARAKLDAAELYMTRMVDDVRDSSARIAMIGLRSIHPSYALPSSSAAMLAA